MIFLVLNIHSSSFDDYGFLPFPVRLSFCLRAFNEAVFSWLFLRSSARTQPRTGSADHWALLFDPPLVLICSALPARPFWLLFPAAAATAKLPSAKKPIRPTMYNVREILAMVLLEALKFWTLRAFRRHLAQGFELDLRDIFAKSLGHFSGERQDRQKVW
jgi:hypothetical protein